MKKVLHITPHLGGGAGKAISGIVTDLKKFSNTILMLEEPVDTRYSDICRKAGATVIISSDEEIIRQKIFSADIVVLNWWAHPLEVDMLQKVDFGNVPVILWSHINGLSYPYLTYDFLKCFDGIMFTSPCAFENYMWSENERSDIISTAKIVYGTGKFYPQMQKCKSTYLVSDKIKICYSGTLDYSKLSRNFPKIIKHISGKCDNAQFYLFGKYSEDFKENFLKELGCENVFFCGFTNDIENILTTMDIFCYPLAKENYATTENALLEAMAAGLPVVVMDNPAERSIVENGKTGIIARSAEEFCEAVLKLCSDEKQREVIGKNARGSVIDKYSFDVNLNAFCSYIDSVKKSNPSDKIKLLLGNDVFDSFRYFCGLNSSDNAFEHCRKNNIFYSESKSSPFHYLQYFPNNNELIRLAALLEQERKNGN